MTTLIGLLGGWWTEILAGLAVIAALVSAYFGGKKIGTTETQAKADVTAQKVQSQQVEAVAKKQSENAEIAKNVTSINSSTGDDDARNKLRESKYNQF